jgi:hypothetical protein
VGTESGRASARRLANSGRAGSAARKKYVEMVAGAKEARVSAME